MSFVLCVAAHGGLPMLIQTKSKGITFPVHDVEAVLTELPTKKTRELMRFLLRDFDSYDTPEPLCLSGYNSESLVDTSQYHALFSTIHQAFSEHRPLVLSPDMIWITILQGFAQHVKNNTEKLRALLVSHTGKKDLMVFREETFVESPEYDWQGVIHDFAKVLSENVPESYSNLISDFSTTGPLERVVSEVAVLDVFQSYFEYIMYAGCGIPYITLEGSVDDWKKLRNKVELLEPYKLDFWIGHLREITDHFYRAAIGDVDKTHWQDIYKQMNTYGATTINGWIVKLIPYVRSGGTGDCVLKNPMISEDSVLWHESIEGIRTDQLPSGISKVPFIIKMILTNETKPMQFLSGFLGGEQDKENFALRPMLGWAVRKSASSESYLFDLPNIVEKVPPKSMADMQEFVENLLGSWQTQRREHLQIPGDFFTFYKQCDGLICRYDEKILWRVKALADLEKITFEYCKLDSEIEEAQNYSDALITLVGPKDCPWLRFLDESDGQFLALELGHKFQVYRVNENTKEKELIAPSFEMSIRAYLDKAKKLICEP